MLDGRGGGAGSGADEGGSGGEFSAPRERKPALAGAGKREDMDDEIPF